MQTHKKLQLVAWLFSAVLAGIAVYAWASPLKGNFADLSVYGLFPLLGLLAFSLMLSHYVASTVRRASGAGQEVLQGYYRLTSYLVLALILLHPGLLVWQLWQDGAGLPPNSVKRYVGAGSYLFVLFGVVALTVFLAYELKRKLDSRPWWWIVERANDLAMVLIFIHGLRLGSNLQAGWYRYVWYVYGAILLFCIVYAWRDRRRTT